MGTEASSRHADTGAGEMFLAGARASAVQVRLFPVPCTLFPALQKATVPSTMNPWNFPPLKMLVGA
jgi:hypothetical protein